MARTYHLTRLPLPRRRMRVAADWAVSAVFPWDITQLGSLGHVRPLAGPSGASLVSGFGLLADRFGLEMLGPFLLVTAVLLTAVFEVLERRARTPPHS